MKGYFTTKQVAQRLNISDARIRRLILDGLLNAEKVGRDNFISEAELGRFEKVARKGGRPKKNTSEGKETAKDE